MLVSNQVLREVYRFIMGLISRAPVELLVIIVLNDLTLPALAGENMDNLLRSSSDTELEAEGRASNDDFPDRAAPVKALRK